MSSVFDLVGGPACGDEVRLVSPRERIVIMHQFTEIQNDGSLLEVTETHRYILAQSRTCYVYANITLKQEANLIPSGDWEDEIFNEEDGD